MVVNGKIISVFCPKVIVAYIGLVMCNSFEANWWQQAHKEILLLITGQQLLHWNAKVLPTRESLSSTTVVFEQFKIFCNIIVILEIGRDFIIHVTGGRRQCVKIGGSLGSANKLESPKPVISHKRMGHFYGMIYINKYNQKKASSDTYFLLSPKEKNTEPTPQWPFLCMMSHQSTGLDCQL